jgi:limonene-1,2-epoxide hydrolase
MPMTNTELVRAYYAAWLRDDLDAVMALCTADVTAVNVPIGPIHGRAAVQEFFGKFARGMSQKRYEVARILESGDCAVVEGVENYVKNGRQVSLPYMSTFMFRDGLICEWRDYFDVQTVLRQLGLPLDGSRPPRASTPAAVAGEARTPATG